VRSQGCPPRCPEEGPPSPHVEALEPPCASRLTSFGSPPQPLGRGRVGTVEPCREELPLAPGAVRQMPFTNDVRCAVRQPGRRRRPGCPGCAAAPACRTFLRRFAASLVDHGSRGTESGENAWRTQKGASDSDAGLHRDAASKAHAGFVERSPRRDDGWGAGSWSEGRETVSPAPLVGPDGLVPRREGPRQVMAAQSGTICVPRRTASGGRARLTIRILVITSRPPPLRWVPDSLRYVHCSGLSFSQIERFHQTRK
jgi:hypothetical protein